MASSGMAMGGSSTGPLLLPSTILPTAFRAKLPARVYANIRAPSWMVVTWKKPSPSICQSRGRFVGSTDPGSKLSCVPETFTPVPIKMPCGIGSMSRLGMPGSRLT